MNAWLRKYIKVYLIKMINKGRVKWTLLFYYLTPHSQIDNVHSYIYGRSFNNYVTGLWGGEGTRGWRVVTISDVSAMFYIISGLFIEKVKFNSNFTRSIQYPYNKP